MLKLDFRSILLTLLLLVALPALAQPAKGLVATYYRGHNFETVALVRTDPTIDFNWDYASPGLDLPSKHFSVRWTGYLRAPVSGTYTFAISTDDGMRVWLGDQQLFDEWRPQVPTTYKARVQLTAGQFYTLRVEYYQLEHQARAQLRWLLPDEEEPSTNESPGLLPTEPKRIPPSVLLPHAPGPMASVEPVGEPPITESPAPELAPLDGVKHWGAILGYGTYPQLPQRCGG